MELRDDPLLESLFESSHVLVALLDPELRFVRVNRAYATFTGRPAESFVGQGHFDLYPHAENEAMFRTAIAENRPFRVSARPFEHPDRPEIPVTYWDFSLDPVVDREGRPLGILFQFVDVTDHVVAKRLAEERRLMIREINHRVKNNIQIVASFLRDVSSTHPECGPTVDRALARIGSITRIHELLASARDVSRVDLSRYAHGIAQEVSTIHGRAGIQIEVSGVAVAPVDLAGLMGMVLQELLSNAFEHAFPAGVSGRVDVQIEMGEREYRIEVCDDGIGLPERRLLAAGSHGLDLVLGLCEQIGGRFEAHALSPRGTCCHLIVPIPPSIRELSGGR